MSEHDPKFGGEPQGMPIEEFLMQITQANAQMAVDLSQATERMVRLTKGFTVLGGVMLAALVFFALGSGMGLVADMMRLGFWR
jgi:hypothetical protein